MSSRVPLSRAAVNAGVFVAALVVLAACATNGARTDANAGADACSAATVATSAWTEFAASRFTIRIPPGFERVEMRGIDSEIGQWKRGSDNLGFDYGMYSARIDSTDMPGYSDAHRCSMSIGDRRATIVTAQHADSGYLFVGAHWRDLPVANSARDGAVARMDISLTIYGRAASVATRDELLASIRSVRFRESTR